MRRRDSRRQTKFGSWIQGFGVSRLVSELRQSGFQIHCTAVYHWIDGSVAPRAPLAIRLVELSAGELSMSAIYSHRDELSKIDPRALAAPKSKA